MRLPVTLQPLAVRPYRLLFAGAALSNVGTWMHRIAVDWMVYTLTDSIAWVGAVTFAQFAPFAVMAPLGGVLADRVDRRKLLLWAQTSMMVIAFALAGLALAGLAGPVVLLVTSLLLGICQAFHGPTWQATVPHLVPRELLTKAIALNSTQFSMARIVGPALGGVGLALIGAGGVFVINAFSYAAVIAAILALQLPPVEAREQAGVRSELAAGFRYAIADRQILWIIGGVMAVSVLAAPLVTLLPAYARDILGGDERTLGILTGALGVGSLLGSFLLGQLRDSVPSSRLIGGGLVALSVAMAGIALSANLIVIVVLIGATGLLRLGSIAASNSRLQTRTHDAFRGRVMSLFMLAFGGSFPIGALVAGNLAERFGVQAVTLGMAAATLLAGLMIWDRLNRAERPAPVTAPRPAASASGDPAPVR